MSSNAGCSLWRAGGFFFSLEKLHWGPKIYTGKMPLWIKNLNFFQLKFPVPVFDLKNLDPDSMKMDPQQVLRIRDFLSQILDPNFNPSRISDLGCQLMDPGCDNNVTLPLFWSHKFHKIDIIFYFWDQAQKKFEPIDKEYTGTVPSTVPSKASYNTGWQR